MKIERVDAVTSDIETFAYVYCLTMVITRVKMFGKYRYYASFKDVKVMTNSGTAFVQGTALSEEAAIQDYAVRIKFQRMILPRGRTVNVWNLKC